MRDLLCRVVFPILTVLAFFAIGVILLIGYSVILSQAHADSYWHRDCISTETLNFTDTVTMVQTTNSWWGLGSTESLNITLLHGFNVATNYTVTNQSLPTFLYSNPTPALNYTVQSLVYSGNYAVEVGKTYQFTCEVQTFRDNHTVVLPRTIALIGDN